MDLAKKILNSVSHTNPATFSPDDIRGHDKDLKKLSGFGIIQRRTALTFPCGECGNYCEIKTLENGDRVILCDSCENARLYTLTEEEGFEYSVSLPALLKNFLSELGLSTEHINPSFRDRLWTLGVHDINGASREIFFLRDAHDSEAEIFAFLGQKKASHPIVLSATSQSRLLNTAHTIIPLENLLASRGNSIFSKKHFDKLFSGKGKTSSRNGIALGSDIVLEEKELLYSPDGFGNYQREKLEPLEQNIIENLYRRGCSNKDKWYSRKEIAGFWGKRESSVSNAMTEIRKISKKIGIEIVEQNESTKKYRINPDLVPEQFVEDYEE